MLFVVRSSTHTYIYYIYIKELNIFMDIYNVYGFKYGGPALSKIVQRNGCTRLKKERLKSLLNEANI